MEVKQELKKCEFCKGGANSLCYQCMSYFCDSCYKIAHSKEETKSHKKEKIDYFCTIDLKCPEHHLYPMGLFCIDEKGKKF